MLVVDANILIRAVLGQRVARIIDAYADVEQFVTPDTAFAEARDHLPGLFAMRSFGAMAVADALSRLADGIYVVGPETYDAHSADARRRIGLRDPDDWPVLAVALALDCPIWTEDRDFFGVGVATWTTSLIEVYLDRPPANSFPRRPSSLTE